MNISDLSVQTNVLLDTGDSARILAVNQQEETVQIKYLDALGQPGLVGTEAWVSIDAVIAIDQGSHSEGAT